MRLIPVSCWNRIAPIGLSPLAAASGFISAMMRCLSIVPILTSMMSQIKTRGKSGSDSLRARLRRGAVRAMAGNSHLHSVNWFMASQYRPARMGGLCCGANSCGSFVATRETAPLAWPFLDLSSAQTAQRMSNVWLGTEIEKGDETFRPGQERQQGLSQTFRDNVSTDFSAARGSVQDGSRYDSRRTSIVKTGREPR